MININQIKAYIKRNKEGALLGAIVGYFMALAYTKLGGADLTFVLQSQGMIDNLITTVQAPQIIYIKLALFSIMVGAMAGMILDEHVRWL